MSRRSAGEVADCEVADDCLNGGEQDVAAELVDCRLRGKGYVGAFLPRWQGKIGLYFFYKETRVVLIFLGST